MTSALVLLWASLPAFSLPAPHAPPPQTLPIVLPDGFPEGHVAISLMCRDARSQWSTILDWRQAAGPPFTVDGPAGRRCRVMVRPAGTTSYLTSAEIAWSPAAQPVAVGPTWQRTIRAPAAGAEVLWLGASGRDEVECESRAAESRCLFVPADTAGVMSVPGRGALQFAIVSRDDTQFISTWKSAPWGRLVRVRAPSGGAVDARTIVMQPSLRHGSGQMREARPASGASVHRLAPDAFWLEGGASPRAELELRSVGAATTRLPLASLATPFPSAVDIALPVEELITGDVRSRGALIEGVTVVLVTALEGPDPADREEDPPLERVDEVVTGRSGDFTFAGLSRGKYELLALHPSRGRARTVATPPTHVRLELRPRAIIRGRVVQDGAPVPYALVQASPSVEAVTSARNPIALFAEPVRSGPDGRFEVVAPDEGSVLLSVTAESGSFRAHLGDAAALAETLDVGDIKLQAALDLEVVADLPAGCELQAAGPMGATGLSVIRGALLGPARWRITPPLPGRWFFAGVCAGKELALDPPVVEVPPARQGPILLKLRR